MAPGSTHSLPKGPEQQEPPPSNLTPRPAQANYLFTCLQMFMPPTYRTATHSQFFIQNWKQIAQDTWTLQTIQGYKIPFCRCPRQWHIRVTRVKGNVDTHHNYGNGYQGLISKGSCPGSQTAGRPINVNPVLGTKRKWRLLTRHQPLCSKSIP